MIQWIDARGGGGSEEEEMGREKWGGDTPRITGILRPGPDTFSG